MQVEMQSPYIVGERAVAGERVRVLLFSLGAMMVMLILCSPQARAQGVGSAAGMAEPGKASAADAAATTGTQKTRSRRVVDSTTALTEGSAESDANESMDGPAPVTGNGDERLMVLRAQIEGAKTDAERARLERVLIDYLVALGRKNEAVAELRVMSRAERLDPIGFYNIGNALARLGDTDTAIDAYRKAVSQRHGNYSRALNNMGVMFLRQGRWDEAQESFASALRLENYRYGEASYNLGRVYNARGEANLAIKEWSRTLAIEPDHSDAAVALARAYAEDGSPERGLEVLDNFVARRGPSQEMANARREILSTVDAGAAAKPDASTNTATPIGPAGGKTGAKADSGGTGARKASGEKPAGDKRAASAAALRPLAVDRETYELLRRARAARDANRNDEAAGLYRKVLVRANGFFPPANLELSFVLSELARHEEAAETLSAVVKREGARYPIAYFYMGRQYEALGRLPLAAEAFEKAAEAYGDTNPQFLLDLMRVREKEGNAQAALDAMENYLRISRTLGRIPDWSAERIAQLRQKAQAGK